MVKVKKPVPIDKSKGYPVAMTPGGPGVPSEYLNPRGLYEFGIEPHAMDPNSQVSVEILAESPLNDQFVARQGYIMWNNRVFKLECSIRRSHDLTDWDSRNFISFCKRVPTSVEKAVKSGLTEYAKTHEVTLDDRS